MPAGNEPPALLATITRAQLTVETRAATSLEPACHRRRSTRNGSLRVSSYRFTGPRQSGGRLGRFGAAGLTDERPQHPPAAVFLKQPECANRNRQQQEEDHRPQREVHGG